MITSSEEGSNKILVAISLDRDESQNALSWAINVLAKPNDTIVALHLLGKCVYTWFPLFFFFTS